MKKVVVDTNILVSASFWEGNPYKIMQLAAKGKIEAFASTEILEEFATALGRDFKKSQQETDERIDAFLEVVKLVEPKMKIHQIKEDVEDNKILEAAIEAKADCIVSGDSHLLKLKEFRGVKIVKARQFLEETK